MVAFDPTEDQKLIVDTVAEFAKTTLSPRAREFEKDRGIAEDVRKAAQEMSLCMAAVPEDLGGQGLGLVAAVLINEELAYGDPAAPFGLPGFGGYLLAAMELGTKAQAEKLVEPFADPEAHDQFGAIAWSEPKAHPDRPGFVTTATEKDGGWVLDGVKSFIGNVKLAKSFIVFAQIDESKGWDGLGAFAVDAGADGIEVTKTHETLGLECAAFGDVELSGVKGQRLGQASTAKIIDFWAKYGLLVAARQVGLSRVAFDLAREYCDIRKAFGKPIGHFQAVAFNLADRHMDAEAAKDMVRRAAWAWDAGKSSALGLSAQAIAQAHETAMRCGNDSVQLHGGAGFMRDVIVEKLMRDAKQIALAGPTASQMDQLAAAVELGQKLDPALVLPTPETQAIFT